MSIELSKNSALLTLPEQLYGTIKRVGILNNEPILYGDVNLLKVNDLFYINGAKQVYRYVGYKQRLNSTEGSDPLNPKNLVSSKEGDIIDKPQITKIYLFTPIKSYSDIEEELTIPEQERGIIRNAGYLFNEIIYSGDANLVENGNLFYHDTLSYISIVSNVDDVINLSTKKLDEKGDITTVVTEYRVSPELHDYSKDYLTFEALEDGTFTLTIKKDDYGGTLDITSISYSIDNGNNWVTTQRSADATTTITTPTITQGDKVLWKGIATSFYTNKGPGIPSIFSSTGKFNVCGNIMSLLYDDDFEDKIAIPGTEGKFGGMFQNATNLINAENLILPATTLTTYCYYYMFYGCTSLTTAPELPATTLANNCYGYMFKGCSNLNYIKAMFTTTPSYSYTSDWVSGVSATGTFVKNSAATWNVTGNNGIPSGWTVETADS